MPDSASVLTIAPVPIAETRTLRQRVLRPHQSLAEMAGSEPADGYAVGAFAAGQLIAVGIIGPDPGPDVWRVRGMAADPLHRGKGAGSAVLAALVDRATGAGARRIWCNARTPALALYERAGFIAASAEFELADIGPHVRMERVLDVLR